MKKELVESTINSYKAEIDQWIRNEEMNIAKNLVIDEKEVNISQGRIEAYNSVLSLLRVMYPSLIHKSLNQ